MKRISLIAALAIIFLSCADIQAQSVFGTLKKKQDKKEKEIEGKIIDATIGGAMDKIFKTEKTKTDSVAETESASEEKIETKESTSSSSSSSSSTPDMNSLMKRMGLSSGEAKVKNNYEFEAFMNMNIVEYDSKGNEEESMSYATFLDAESLDYCIAFSEEDSDGMAFMIFDTENSCMITLSEDHEDKTGFVIAFDPETLADMESDIEEDDTDVDPYSIYKTGKKKKILGYSCEEYKIEDGEEKEVVYMWITQDLNKKMNKSFLKNSTFTGMFTYAYYTNGMVLEYIFEDMESGEKTVMTVTDIDLNQKNTITTDGYTFMNMGQMMNDTEEE